jgi:UDP-N-acetylmuramate--alanine ligase
MNLNTIHSVYFVGIGGIGMSAIARFFKQRNVQVSGYDKTETPLTLQLQTEGIHIHYTEDVNLLNKEVDLVIYTPAIPATNQVLLWYQQHQYIVVKRSDILQMISQEMNAVCVAGTHGKTTISTLIAHILRATGFGCNAFLGGISANYDVNYWSSENACAVIEADEYDRSFLKLFPQIAVLTAMDADHLDIYGTIEEMERCYLTFVSQIKETLIYKHGLKHARNFDVPQKFSYSLQNDAANYYASEIQMKNGAYSFLFNKDGKVLNEIELNIGGLHNIENAISALAVCDVLQLDKLKVRNAIAAFKGVRRRFEYILKSENCIYIDDYAHHPEELKMLLSSAKALFPDKKVSVVFQPHLFSRTRDFATGFAQSLDIADEVILLDIYPARELPIEGVSSQIILDQMYVNNRHIMSKESILQWVRHADIELLITAGAGDIDQLVNPVKQILQNK